MAYYVIGDDKGFEEAYSAEEIDDQMQTVNSNITTLQASVATANTNINTKQKAITSGTAAPTGGSNGDIYIQY